MKLTITFLVFCVALLSDSGEFPWGLASSVEGPAISTCSFLASIPVALGPIASRSGAAGADGSFSSRNASRGSLQSKLLCLPLQGFPLSFPVAFKAFFCQAH